MNENIEIVKQDAIRMIVNDDRDSILNGEEDGLNYLDELLKYGHEGWQNRTKDELEMELYQRFHRFYKITI